MTWLNEADTTVASTVPKKTWTPDDEKPEPTIVTRVFPALAPEAGSTAVTVGVPESVAPYEKQVGRERTTGCGWFVPSVSVIGARADGAETSGKPGVVTVMALDVTDVTRPSLLTPLTVNVTRVVEGDPKRRPPFRVMPSRPPSDRSSGCRTSRRTGRLRPGT